MGLYDLRDRINWEQACRVLGVRKSTLFRWVNEGQITAYGLGERNRFFLRSECEALIARKAKERRKARAVKSAR